MKRFLASFNIPELRTLQDLVDFNTKHAELELPHSKKLVYLAFKTHFAKSDIYRSIKPDFIRERVRRQDD